ncbi:MAG TPA: thiolase domain-containing protein [Nocardioidaceae bacterium]|nr:thiolase domain-containing protein [Nocardioidaceae bacterium]
MRDVAVVAYATRQAPRLDGSPTMVESLVPVFQDIWDQTGWTKNDIGFWCSGSSDYLAGRAFSFVSAVDAIGTLPPVVESHVEMDAAWALYEAWVKIQTGEVDTAFVYGFGKSSAGQLRRVLALQLDPYLYTPLWPDTVSLAALQARAGIDRGLWDEKAMAEVVAARTGREVADLLAEPLFADPLRKHDCARVNDGATAIVIAAGDKAREVRDNPAWITGYTHNVDSQSLSLRDITESGSTRRAAASLDLGGLDVAELYAPFSHQELILRNELGLDEDVSVNPSGGVLQFNPMFSAGLVRIGEAASRIWDGSAGKTLAHATSGPALQQNLLCLMEANA